MNDESDSCDGNDGNDGCDGYDGYEGNDDMPAHIKTMLTQTSLTIPIKNKQLILGTWQGIYLFEHRYNAHSRKITLSFIGN